MHVSAYRLSVSGILMTHNKAGFCDRSDHSINPSPSLQETQGKQPVPGPPERNRMVASEVGEVRAGNRYS